MGQAWGPSVRARLGKRKHKEGAHKELGLEPEGADHTLTLPAVAEPCGRGRMWPTDAKDGAQNLTPNG